MCGDRNTVAPTIQQELLYVGDESGKLIAIRDIIRKVWHSTDRLTIAME